MLSEELNTARKIVGVIGNVIALFLFLSPAPTFVRIWKRGDVEQYSAAPYLATLINCMVWVLYGLPVVHPHSTLVITINGSGTAIEIVFIFIFLAFCGHRKRLTLAAVLAVEVIFIAVLSVLVMTLLHTTQTRSLAVGIICILFNVMMYASPFAIMKLVIKTKSVEYMPFFLSLAAFANGITWTAYAFMPFDPFIAVPNGLGSLFGLAQLILYGAYYKSTQEIMAERQQTSKVEVVLSNVAVSTSDSKKIVEGNRRMNGA